MTLNLDWPLMRNNITHGDISAVRNFLGYELAGTPVPRLTHGPKVQEFEEAFAAWLGSKYAVMVNSGASANLITMQALAGRGISGVAVPCITWVSDIASVIQAGMTPIFCDIELNTLGLNWKQVPYLPSVAAFPTHCLGFDASDNNRVETMVEDCCESLGATRNGRKLGTFGLASNFSFYYAHHMSTIEGGMVCTDDAHLYQQLRRLRSHGLAREMTDGAAWNAAAEIHPDLDPQFIFMEPAYNVRPTEINAVIGLSQLKRLDDNIGARHTNLIDFLGKLDANKYRALYDYKVRGSSNYALPLVLREADRPLMQRVLKLLKESGVEFRKGLAGGGNQLRQPYAKKRFGADFHKRFPNSEFVSDFGLYVGNFPDLEPWKIDALCEKLNAL